MINFKDLEESIKIITERLSSEFKTIQTGRATPTVLENIHIDAYGSKMHISHVAGISVEDSKTLRVSPYDKGLLKELELSINQADLGLSLASDSEGLRIIFPVLTTERRVQYVKIAKDKFEDAKIKIKLAREECKRAIEKSSKDGDLSEDDKNSKLAELQKIVDKSNEQCESLLTHKEAELMGIN
jgi:ribosome recycling factor